MVISRSVDDTRLKRWAKIQNPILILGPTGVGKSELAIRLFEASSLKGQLVRINLATVSDNLIESELFGHVRGSFTGALRDRTGRLVTAQGGMVFLDEIGELSLNLQKKLLDFLQTGEVVPVGSNQGIKVNTRIVLATHQDLPRLVAEGKFRQDLYYRIKNFVWMIPGIKEDPVWFDGLLYHFLKILGDPTRVSSELLDRLEKHSWPGNIRELKAVIQYIYEATDDVVLSSKNLPDDFHHFYPVQTVLPAQVPVLENILPEESWGGTFDEGRRYFEKHFLSVMLEKNGGFINRTSKKLDISKSTLINKVREYEIDVSAIKQRFNQRIFS